MRWTYNNEFRYLQFPLLSDMPGFWHGVFTRHTLDEKGRKISLNLGLKGGDPDQQVWDRRRRVIEIAGARLAVFARQVHGADVAVWGAPERKAAERGYAYLSGDALITAATGTALFILTADCQSVLVADPVRRVVANVHSGWRGSIGNVIGRTVETMRTQFNCRPEHLHCGIGPSLGPCCAEFIHYRKEIPERYWAYRRSGDLFDFWRLSVDQLSAAGVPYAQIAVSGICTRCNPQTFFSYRGEGQQAGRFAAVISLAPD